VRRDLVHEDPHRAAAHQPDVGGLLIADPVGGDARRPAGEHLLRLAHQRALDAPAGDRALDAPGVVDEHLGAGVERRGADRLHERRGDDPATVGQPLQRGVL
jgi:hypothetical protein